MAVPVRVGTTYKSSTTRFLRSHGVDGGRDYAVTNVDGGKVSLRSKVSGQPAKLTLTADVFAQNFEIVSQVAVPAYAEKTHFFADVDLTWPILPSVLKDEEKKKKKEA